MMVREKLTGLEPPPAARKLVDLWRPWIEEKAGKDLARLDGVIENQRAFAAADQRSPRPSRPARRSQADRDDPDESEDDSQDDEQSEGQDGQERHRGRQRSPCRSRTPRPARTTPRRATRRKPSPPPPTCRRTRRQARPRRRASPGGRREPRRRAPGARLQGLLDALRRGDRRAGPLRPRGARPAARLSRQAARQPVGRGGAARQPPAAPADGAAEPRVGLRPRGGRARSGAAVARHHRPDIGAVVHARARHRLPRHGGDAAPRQFRLDARAPDHGGGDLRRHPRADARALRRQGRDPRLHHARLEGRAGARGVAAGRQARQSGAPQRPSPHHLQVGRRAVAAGAQEPRPDDARGPPQGEHRRRGARLGASAPARAAPRAGAS